MMMKRVLLFVLLSSVALATAAQTPQTSVEVRGSQFQLPAKAYPMFPRDVEYFAGAYDLSNGETMYLRKAGRRLYAEIGNRPAKELVAVSPNEFVALDRQARMTFEENAGGMTGEVLMIVPRKISSIGGSEVVRLSAR
jgi:hypothetical protein